MAKSVYPAHIMQRVIVVLFRKILQVLNLATVVVLTTEIACAASPTGNDMLCDQIAERVARESGVPVTVLQAITRTETGRRRNGATRPWPWTVNMEGTGMWFDTEAEALRYVHQHYDRGARSFDVGCFQINYRWHGQHFTSIEQMFEPLANARYAARFLRELHNEKGNWSDAAGAYHSRTATYANRYKRRFNRYRAALNDAPAPSPVPVTTREPTLASQPVQPTTAQVPAQPIVVARVNQYPLLQASDATRTHGSLVPLATLRGHRLIGN